MCMFMRFCYRSVVAKGSCVLLGERGGREEGSEESEKGTEDVGNDAGDDGPPEEEHVGGK